MTGDFMTPCLPKVSQNCEPPPISSCPGTAIPPTAFCKTRKFHLQLIFADEARPLKLKAPKIVTLVIGKVSYQNLNRDENTLSAKKAEKD